MQAETQVEHPDYNYEYFPLPVRNHGNWDIYANANGHCAAIPTPKAKAFGCRASHFGDLQYVKITLCR